MARECFVFVQLPGETAPIVAGRLLAALKPKAYFTHHTAARIHQLTTTNLNKIYLNVEQRPHAKGTAPLTQGAIDRAFSNASRVTTNLIEVGRNQIYLLNGMNTSDLGVIEDEITYEKSKIKVRVTNIERTLIDLTVRPAYAGGVAEVAKAFQNAKGKTSIKRLSETLTKLDYVYPYHQAIGYYLEIAGYADSDLDFFRSIPMNFDFYLANQLSNTQYVSQWRLHVPT